MKQILCSIILFILIPITLVSASEKQALHASPDKPVAPEFELKDIDGKVHKLSDYRGKVVIVNFWATWCPPCRFEIPSMERAQKKLANDNIIILAINIGEDEDTIFEFIGDYNINFPILMDLDSSTIKNYPVVGLPTSYVVDPKGKTVYRAIGGREWDDVTIINKLRALSTNP